LWLLVLYNFSVGGYLKTIFLSFACICGLVDMFYGKNRFVIAVLGRHIIKTTNSTYILINISNRYQ
jgi:hypothetical protein